MSTNSVPPELQNAFLAVEQQVVSFANKSGLSGPEVADLIADHLACITSEKEEAEPQAQTRGESPIETMLKAAAAASEEVLKHTQGFTETPQAEAQAVEGLKGPYDISSECVRTYVYPHGNFHVFHPKTLYVKKDADEFGDSHRILTEAGEGIYIPSGWVAIEWTGHKGQPATINF